MSTHLDARGQAHMVDVGEKATTARRAVARARVRMSPATVQRLVDERVEKGDVFAAARIAGILAAKRTPELVPLCHAIQLTRVTVDLVADVAASAVAISAVAEARDRTGVEMEALVAASVAALTVYDMLKSSDRFMTIEGVELVEKSGGRSGHLKRPGA